MHSRRSKKSTKLSAKKSATAESPTATTASAKPWNGATVVTANWKNKTAELRELAKKHNFNYEKIAEVKWYDWQYTKAQIKNGCDNHVKNSEIDVEEESSEPGNDEELVDAITPPTTPTVPSQVAAPVVASNAKQKLSIMKTYFKDNKNTYVTTKQEKSAKKRGREAQDTPFQAFEEEADDIDEEAGHNTEDDEEDEMDSKVLKVIQEWQALRKKKNVEATPTKGTAIKQEVANEPLQLKQEASFDCMFKPARIYTANHLYLLFRNYEPFVKFSIRWVRDQNEQVTGWEVSYKLQGWPDKQVWQEVLFKNQDVKAKTVFPRAKVETYSEAIDLNTYARLTAKPRISPIKLPTNAKPDEATYNYYELRLDKKAVDEETMEFIEFVPSE